MKEGSSVVSKREGGEEFGISMGPSDSVMIVLMTSARNVNDDEEEGGMAEIEKEEEEVGGLRKGRREGGLLSKSGGMGRKWFEFEKRRWW
ncbi:hypothetical protein TSUD_53210 [Trifolium subterraneum]|uniref:Uncharacterized protein n=1 Tax=Trifolium subterraneum TaxID=3900 RepID=A0A2Z6NDB6_TRISU|nr:hypothetical protein TSUD_53210 [Trifolium subterraneum]